MRNKAKVMLALSSQSQNHFGDFAMILSAQHLIGTVFSWNKTVHTKRGKSDVSKVESDEASISLVKFAMKGLFDEVDVYIETASSKIRTRSPILLDNTKVVLGAINAATSAIKDLDAFSEELSELNNLKEQLDELYDDIDRAINRFPQNKKLALLEESIKAN